MQVEESCARLEEEVAALQLRVHELQSQLDEEAAASVVTQVEVERLQQVRVCARAGVRWCVTTCVCASVCVFLVRVSVKVAGSKRE